MSTRHIMLVPLKIVTEYSLLKSTIKIDGLIEFLKQHNITSCAICDNNLYGIMEFFTKLNKNHIKPIIGLEVNIENYPIYLYPTNNDGYKNLLKIHTLKQTNKLKFDILTQYLHNIKIVLPYNSYELLPRFPEAYLSYQNDTEKIECLLKTNKYVFIREAKCLLKEDTKYLKYLEAIEKGCSEKDVSNNYDYNYLNILIKQEDEESTINFIKDINLEINKPGNYIPIYNKNIDSFKYLSNLAEKGLKKRLNNKVPEIYINRLNYELQVIKKMGFTDYFLIVYDYVLYAKKNNILVGPGRGSAAGSLVSYSIGITEVDPLKYNLLFERFLNPERITMPDIDIDFEYTKRAEVINYVKEKYGSKKVAPIITFGSLASKQVLRDVGRIFSLDIKVLDNLVNLIDVKLSLEKNAEREEIKSVLKQSQILSTIYNIGVKLEGLKRHISTHAAGIVISNTDLDEIIPLHLSSNAYITGCTMEYLEPLGLLKMDFLALRNLTIIKNVLDLIEKETQKTINLNQIDLNEKEVYKLFCDSDTEGIFQFESSGMKNLLQKLKPTNFSDLVASIALFRPGPMNNIDSYIKRKNGLEKVEYIIPDLENILKETYGIIVYQEQVMQILVQIGGYSYAQADNIRRAMSKKKEEIIKADKAYFIESAQKRGYQKELAIKIYDLILKFANYGFNKAHSVSYALIGYQMAYLKVKYPFYFLMNLLNMSLGSEIKTKEYIEEARKKDIKILKPDINLCSNTYININNYLMLPLGSVKNLGSTASTSILEERAKNGIYTSYLNFITRIYGKSNNKKTITSLIDAGVLDCFNLTKKTMIENLDIAINYASLITELDEAFVTEPLIKNYQEYDDDILRTKELNSYGFYIANHPVSKYNDKGIMKLVDIKQNFNKVVKCVVLIENIKSIKTKKQENMAFITASDETKEAEFILFPNGYNLINNIKHNDIVIIQGLVTKRFDTYQITINTIKKVVGENNA